MKEPVDFGHRFPTQSSSRDNYRFWQSDIIGNSVGSARRTRYWILHPKSHRILSSGWILRDPIGSAIWWMHLGLYKINSFQFHKFLLFMIFESFWTSTVLKPSDESFSRDEIMITVTRLTRFTVIKFYTFLCQQQQSEDKKKNAERAWQ